MANEGKAMDAALDYIIKQDQLIADYIAFIQITEMGK